jgi:hypothetical protein
MRVRLKLLCRRKKCHVEWLSEGWYICHDKQMQLWHVTFATRSAEGLSVLTGDDWKRQEPPNFHGSHSYIKANQSDATWRYSMS